jgi:hypothetical protein
MNVTEAIDALQILAQQGHGALELVGNGYQGTYSIHIGVLAQKTCEDDCGPLENHEDGAEYILATLSTNPLIADEDAYLDEEGCDCFDGCEFCEKDWWDEPCPL